MEIVLENCLETPKRFRTTWVYEKNMHGGLLFRIAGLRRPSSRGRYMDISGTDHGGFKACEEVERNRLSFIVLPAATYARQIVVDCVRKAASHNPAFGLNPNHQAPRLPLKPTPHTTSSPSSKAASARSSGARTDWPAEAAQNTRRLPPLTMASVRATDSPFRSLPVPVHGGTRGTRPGFVLQFFRLEFQLAVKTRLQDRLPLLRAIGRRNCEHDTRRVGVFLDTIIGHIFDDTAYDRLGALKAVRCKWEHTVAPHEALAIPKDVLQGRQPGVPVSDPRPEQLGLHVHEALGLHESPQPREPP